MTKKRVGIILIVIAAVLLVAVIVSVGASLPRDGQWKGAITQYKPPFYGHGLLMILLGIAAAVSFLTGAVLIVMDKK